MRNPFRVLLALAATSVPAALAPDAEADALTDGSTGAVTNLTSANFVVPHTLGTTSGANLYHSFDYFNVVSGGSATFTGPAGYTNVISRVTGGTQSQIDGALISSIPGAHFFFINPAGVTFGAGASVNVPAGFHVSTADTLTFDNADVLLSALGPGSTFSAAIPQAFGFIGAPGGTITLNGAHLNLGVGFKSFFADDMVMTNDASIDVGPALLAITLSDDLQMALGSSISAANPSVVTNPQIRIQISADQVLMGVNTQILSTAISSGDGADISIAARQVGLTAGANITALTTGAAASGAAGAITLTATEQVTLFGNSSIQNQGSDHSTGDLGLVSVDAPLILLNGSAIASNFDVDSNIVAPADDGVSAGVTLTGGVLYATGRPVFGSGSGPSIFTQTNGHGESGPINITMDEVHLLNGAEISADGKFAFAGPVTINTGLLEVRGNNVTFDENSGIRSRGGGPNSSIVINADDVIIADEAEILTGLSGDDGGEADNGPGGDITIHATNSITQVNFGQILAIAEDAATNDAGSVFLFAPTITTTDSIIASSVTGGTLGQAGDVELTAGNVNLLRSIVLSTTDGAGDAGHITITASGDVSSVDGYIASGSSDVSQGAAGDVTINADTITISGHVLPPTYVDTQGAGGSIGADNGFGGVSSATDTSQSAGNVTLTATTSIDLDDTQIFAIAEEGSNGQTGAAGDVILSAPNININATMVSSMTTTPSSAGLVQITAPVQLNLTGNSVISSQTTGAGNGGQVNITAGAMTMVGDAAHNWLVEAGLAYWGYYIAPAGTVVTSSAAGPSTGNAGNVDINVAGALTMTGATISSESVPTFGDTSVHQPGNAGDVFVSSGSLTMTGSTISSATEFWLPFLSGPGLAAGRVGGAGDVTIETGVLIAQQGSQIRSDTAQDANTPQIPQSAYTAVNAGNPFPAVPASGNVSVTATTSLLLSASTISSRGWLGDSGSVTVTTPSLTASGATFSPIAAPTTQVFGNGLITAQVYERGTGQDVTINAGSILLSNGGGITTASGTQFNRLTVGAPVAAGDVLITANSLTLDGVGVIGSRPVGSTTTTGLTKFPSNIAAFATNAGGAGGNVVIDVDTLNVLNGASIAATTVTGQPGGNVTINAQAVTMGGAPPSSLYGINLAAIPFNGIILRPGSTTVPIIDMGIATSTFGAGAAGDILLTTDTLEIGDEATLSSDTLSSGESGEVRVIADTAIIRDGGGISTSTIGGSGNAGQVRLDVRATLLQNGRIDSIAAYDDLSGPAPTGNAGTIRITGESLALIGGDADIGAQTEGAGDAGSIIINLTGDLTIDGSTDDATNPQESANIASNNIDVGLGSPLGDAGSVSITARDVTIRDGEVRAYATNEGSAGSITLNVRDLTVNGGAVNVETVNGATSGSTTITARNVLLTDAEIQSRTVGEGDAGAISITAQDLVRLTDSSILAQSQDLGDTGGGSAGSISLTAARLLSADSEIATNTQAVGDAGDITLTMGVLLEAVGTSISSVTSGAGASGNIALSAPTIRVLGGSQISSSTLADGAGGTLSLLGDVILVRDSIVTNGAEGAGDGGDMIIDAATRFDLIGSNILAGTEQAGAGGSLSVDAPIVNIQDSYIVAGAGAAATGASGSVSLSGGSLTMSGVAPDLFGLYTVPSLRTRIDVETLGAATGGSVNLNFTGSVLMDGALISATTSGSGAAGGVHVTAPTVNLIHGALITAETSSAGAAGNVRVDAATSLTLSDSSVISSETGAAGAAGTVTIRTGALALHGDSPTANPFTGSIGSSISASSQGFGPTGSVDIGANTILIDGDSDIAVFLGSPTLDNMTPGSLRVAANALTLRDTAMITTELEVSDMTGVGRSNGAGMTLNITGLLDVGADAQIQSITSGRGNAGAISITAGGVLLNGAIRSSSGAFMNGPTDTGRAGNITINAPTINVSADGSINSEAYTGPGGAGNVSLTGNLLNLAGELTAATDGSTGSAGRVTVNVREINLNGGALISDGGGANAGVFVTTDRLTMTNASQISTLTTGGGASAPAAGPVQVNATQFVSLDNLSTIRSSSNTGGNAGAISITSPAVSLRNGSTILTDAEVFASGGTTAGNAGPITISTDALLVSGAAQSGAYRVHSNIGAFAGQGAGRAGNVTITAGTLTLVDGGQITAFSNNQFAGGTVTIDADTVMVRGTAGASVVALPALYGLAINATDVGASSALIADAFGAGAAGTIIVRAQDITFADGGVARSNTSASGAGGTIIICPDGTLLVTGVGSALLANSSAGSTGNAGVIGVQAHEVNLELGGRITVASAGAGAGGQVVVRTHEFTMTNAGGGTATGQATAINTLVSGAAGASSQSGAGQVAIIAGRMTIDAGALVTTDTTGAAPAGRILFQAGDLSINGGDQTVVSSASTSTNRGNAGVIQIEARNLDINGARISTLSESGSGGQVLISVDNQLRLVGGEITTQVRGTTSDSNAGDINIGQRPQLINVVNPCQTYCGVLDPFQFAPPPNPADGIPDTFVNDGGSIVGSAEVGRGGEVTIHADNIVNNGLIQSDPDSGIDVSSVSGIDGTTTVTGVAFSLPNFVIAPDNDFRSMCEAQQRGAESQFIEALGAQAYDPAGLNFAPYVAAPGSPVAANDGLFLTCSTVDASAERAAPRPPPRRRGFLGMRAER